jgi:hypothetical protein
MDSARQSDATIGLVAKCFMEQAEEASALGNGDRHGAKFSKNLLPFFHRQARLSWGHLIQEGKEAVLAVLGQLDGHQDGIDDPSKDELVTFPVGVALSKFPGQHGFFAMLIVKLV